MRKIPAASAVILRLSGGLEVGKWIRSTVKGLENIKSIRYQKYLEFQKFEEYLEYREYQGAHEGLVGLSICKAERSATARSYLGRQHRPLQLFQTTKKWRFRKREE